MTGRLITAPADKISGLDFFDAITGSSAEKREARRQQMYEQCIAAIERGDTYGWPPVMVDHCRLLMQERADLDPKELPNGRLQVAA